MSATLGFRDRVDAGRQLGKALQAKHLENPVVLGVPRGGVPVAAEVARILHAPLDVVLVRKLGVPGQEELAFGAIAPGGVRRLNDDVVQLAGITPDVVARVEATQRRELERRADRWLGERPPLDVQDRTVVVVDDGIATGASMVAALEALRLLGVRRLVCAIPVGSVEGCEAAARVADEVVCLATPPHFGAVGLWYGDFSETTDEDVDELLAGFREAELV
jgi:predicted phosphoribosyltransferase